MLFICCSRIQALLEREIVARHVAPGACAAVVVREPRGFRASIAAAGHMAPFDPSVVKTTTWFDLASLTKPIIAFCIARCVDRGWLDPRQPLRAYLPWSAAHYAGEVSLDQLLSHRAGLLAHVELYANVRDGAPFDRPRALRQVADAVDPDRRALSEGGFQAVYSDLGYILLGEVLRELTQQPLDVWVHQELESVGLTELLSARRLPDTSSVAPTEDVAWRGGVLRGIVHDDNAFVLSGAGLSGHAGLFGNIAGVSRWVAAALALACGQDRRLGKEAVELLLRPRPGGRHLGGFDGKDPISSSAGTVLGPRTFGHLGFTGTSFWCDPDAGLGVVLLTNRVCPSRGNLSIREARPVVHDQLAQIGAAPLD